jgi:glycerophosphoryl diester phosphodiesterase
MPPIVIAHRGASGHRPEHTLEAYELGARQGADYIEPDLVSTSDGHLVARHENEISGTTDVAERPEFAGRRATKTIDGTAAEGWFVEDFTLAELKTLRARERIPALRPGNAEHDGRHEIPTFQEVIDLAARLSDELGRPVGIYPETKHPSYHREIGLPVEPGLVATLRRNGLDHRGAHVFVQSFEVENLKALRGELAVPLVQLLGPRGGATPDHLEAIAEYADAVGPSKVHIVPRDAAGASLPPTRFVEDAHRARLLVHPYTFRRENTFLPAELRSSEDPAAPGDLTAELRQFFALGVDGVFADSPGLAVDAR